jgi:chaperonin GroES
VAGWLGGTVDPPQADRPCLQTSEDTAELAGASTTVPPGALRSYHDSLMAKTTPQTDDLETVEPIGNRVLIRKDQDKKITKVGIHLPDKIEIPTLTGRIVAVSTQIDHDEDYPIRQYDRVLFNPKNGIPVDFEGDNRLFVIPIEDVVAVFRKE